MKICFAASEGVPLAKGGPYTKIFETKKYLERHGNEVELFNMWETGSRLKEFDVIHIVGSNFSTFGFARNLHYRNIPFIAEPIFYSNRSSNFIKFLSSTDKTVRKVLRGLWFDHGILRDICNYAALISPNTTAEMNLISNAFTIPKEKFQIIPNGVSERFLKADPSLFIEKYGLKDFILNVGHIGPHRKNILPLIKALKKIDHPAVIIGSSLNKDENVKVKDEIGEAKNITLIEELPNDSELLASAYAACNTFVLPSLFETPGIAALEAALAGAKVVITPYGGTKDYFQDLVDYVEPSSVDSIKTGIEKVMNRNKDGRLKERIKENYLWEKVGERTSEVYRDFVEKKSSL